MAAVHGGGYCSSAGLAVRTIMGNALRVAAVDMVGDALVFLGKLSVMAGSGEPRSLMPVSSSLEYIRYRDLIVSLGMQGVPMSSRCSSLGSSPRSWQALSYGSSAPRRGMCDMWRAEGSHVI